MRVSRVLSTATISSDQVPIEYLLTILHLHLSQTDRCQDMRCVSFKGRRVVLCGEHCRAFCMSCTTRVNVPFWPAQ